MSHKRLHLAKLYPELYQTLLELDKRIAALADEAGLEKGFTHLLKLRASQINQCAFCIRLHTRDALAHGESSDRISVIPAWRDTDYFTATERAALALLESITLIADDQVPDAVYDAAAEVLSPQQLAAVEWLSAAINTWNRIAIPSRYPVHP